MNSLSWFLYFAEVVPSIAKLILALSLIGLLAVFVLLFVANFTTANRWDSPETVEQKIAFKKFVFGKFWKVVISACIAGLFISALIPSKTTLYLIAGSEAGGTVVTSEEGKEVLNDIKLIIKQQIKSYKD